MADQWSSRMQDFSEEPNLGDRIAEQAEKAKDSLSEVGQKAADQMEEQRRRAADVLSSGASTLHEKAEALPGGPKVVNMAHRAAEGLETTAAYIREHDSKAMMADVGELVKRYPAQFLAGGIVLGFLIGRSFRSSD